MRPGRMNLGDLRGFLGDPEQGGGREDLKVVTNIEEFVERHPDTFRYDGATKTLSLRAIGETPAMDTPAIDLQAEAAETRVVQRLKTMLQRGPSQAASHADMNTRFVAFGHASYASMMADDAPAIVNSIE